MFVSLIADDQLDTIQSRELVLLLDRAIELKSVPSAKGVIRMYKSFEGGRIPLFCQETLWTAYEKGLREAESAKEFEEKFGFLVDF